MLNREMLKQQSIPVGDVDTIANAIDRQKVREIKIEAASFTPAFNRSHNSHSILPNFLKFNF
jgi:hypothetical protein